MPKILAFNREHKRRSAADNIDNRQENTSPQGNTGDNASSKVTQLYPAAGDQAGTDVTITASIVVPTKAHPHLLNRCIASLVLQHFDPHRFEIIIVDDGPNDDTLEVVNVWAVHTRESGPQVVYIPSPGPHGPAAARNIGWRAARGGIIAFTDDDTIARADWLQNGVSAFNEHVHAVWGRIVMPLEGTPTDYELDAKNHLETTEFVSANCFCRKRVLEDVGGFDERFRFAWREDTDLHFNLLCYSASVIHAPNAVVTHPIRPAPWGVSLLQVKKMQFDALLYKKHPRLYRQKIRARPRWDFYLTVCSLLSALIASTTDTEEVAMPAAIVWSYMTARFCVMRLRKTSKKPKHIAEMIVTSALIPPLAVFWRAVGAFKFRSVLL